MPFRTSRGSRQGLPRPSSLRGGSGISGSNTSHCSSVRSMLFHSCQKDVRQSHYILASTFMRWLLVRLERTLDHMDKHVVPGEIANLEQRIEKIEASKGK